MHPLANPETVGDEFVAILTDWLTDYEIDVIRSHNTTPAYAYSCASHNFCDANMAMLTAFEVITECDYDLDNQSHVDLFNAAWDYAKANHLTKKA
jgi:hypothetical protein